ncbi:DUF4382 domain-containing protein [Parapedobacter indicus]|nr:DUF4382 domain-containing protein [Parapedobacter indicus]
MMKKQFVLPVLVALCAVIFFGACSKTGSPEGAGTAKVDLRLTDAPGPFEHVYLDIQGIEFHTDEAGWQTADVILPGVYDVLKLRNGVDSLIASTTLPTGTLSQVRVILGEENSFVIDGAQIPFTVPSGKQSGLKFNVHQELAPDGSYTVWTDFDVAKSIVETGNGAYIVKPVIRVFTELTNGRIKGTVEPMSPDYSVIITAFSATDTATAIPNEDGYFLMSGLPEGDYTVIAEPDSTSGLAASTVTDVPVKFGMISDLGTLTLAPAVEEE